MKYKIAEIREHFNDFMDEYIRYNGTWEGVTADPMELHSKCFNEDYYIIGTQKAIDWMGSKAFRIIEFVKEWEIDVIGEASEDYTDPEMLVNKYTYILGEEVVRDWFDDLETERATA